MLSGNVLVVDDDLPLARNIVSLLSPLGLHTEVAATAGEALDRVSHRQFDLALLDMYLPDGDGIELASQLHERAPDSEVVLVTGNASVEEAARAVGLGAADMLLKPFTPQRLVESVRKALERKRAAGLALEARLRDSRMHALTRLTMGLAHELRNPLNSALLQLQLATRRLRGDGAPSADAIVDRMEVADSELRRLARILTEFEDCIRPASLMLTEVTIDELFDVASRDCAGRAAAAGIAIQREVPAGASLHVDRERLGKALCNLVQNALEAMPQGGTLTLRARLGETHAVLEVEDTGIGISDANVVFDPFYTTKPGGTGLGLTVVHRNVTDHGGTIDVTSQKGRTCFTIVLPQGRSAA